MNHQFNQDAFLEDLRKLGIGLMLVGFIGLIVRKDIPAINGALLSGLGVIIWIIGLIKWKFTWI